MVDSLFILLPCGGGFHNIPLTSPSRLPCNLLRLITHTHPLPRCGGEVCHPSHAWGRGRRGARGEWCDSPLLICRNIGLHNEGVETALGKPAGKPHEGTGKRRERGREWEREREQSRASFPNAPKTTHSEAGGGFRLSGPSQECRKEVLDAAVTSTTTGHNRVLHPEPPLPPFFLPSFLPSCVPSFQLDASGTTPEELSEGNFDERLYARGKKNIRMMLREDY